MVTPAPRLAAATGLAALAAASTRGRIATGPRAGQRPLRLGDRVDPEDLPASGVPLCAQVAGVSLHAAVAVPAHDRQRLERLCRYVARPPLASERLSRLEDGRLLYRLKRRWRDGTTALVFEPLELIERLAALVPPPRRHLVRYHGVLAPASAARPWIVPQPPTEDGIPADDLTPKASPPAPGPGPTPPADRPPGARSPDPGGRYLSWAELLRRVFALDALRCPQCITDYVPRS